MTKLACIFTDFTLLFARGSSVYISGRLTTVYCCLLSSFSRDLIYMYIIFFLSIFVHL